MAMRHSWRRGRVAVALAVAAAAGTIAGCGQPPSDADASSPETVAYRQFKDAGQLFDCFRPYDTVLAAGRTDTFDVPELRQAARDYSDRNATYVAALVRIEFPPDAKPIADELRQTVTAEILNLDLLSGISTRADAYPLLNQVYFAEAEFNERSDRLRESLDRPVPQASRALSQFELARQTAQKDTLTVHRLFDTALVAGDLDAARNVSRIQQQLLAQFSASLDGIDFPDAFRARVVDLKAKIQASVDYHRRQVDVPNVTLIVATPPEGGPEFQAKEQAASAISDDLAKVDPPQSRPPDC
jgi:hypothetical protein